MTARLRVSPPCAAAAAQSGRSKAVITAQSKGEAIKVGICHALISLDSKLL